MNVLEVRSVRKTYDSEGAPVRALRGVDLEIGADELVAIMGPSGCGKSTLLNLVAGLDTPTEGEILVAGESLSDKGEDDLARMRRMHIGVVFQFFNLLEGMSALENVTLPAVIAGSRRRQAESRARDLLDLLGLADKASSAPGVLSGGQRQRLAIARALANAPTLLLADEPTGALDSEGGMEVLELFRRLHAGGQAILLVTHDEEVAAPATARRAHARRTSREPGARRRQHYRECHRGGRLSEPKVDEIAGPARLPPPRLDRSAPVGTPIVVADLGRPRERATPATRQPRQAISASRLVSASILGALSLAGAVAAPVIDLRGDLYTEVVRAVVVGAFALAGMVALIMRPSEKQPLLILFSAFLGSTAIASSALVQAAAHGSSVGPGMLDAAHLLEPLALALLPMAAMHLMLGLPDGSCRLSRAFTAGGYLAGIGVGLVLWTRRPALPLWPVGIEIAVAAAVGITGAQRRYARSTGLERQRMQWFGWAVGVGAEILLVALALRLLWGWPTRAPLVVAIASLPVAVALTMGSLRRFAGRIDRILSHTVSLAGLTGVVVIVYFVVVVAGLGHTPTTSQRSLLALSMLAAALAALLYGPARERLGQYANRVVYGEREAPDAVLRTFGSRLSRSVPMGELLLQVAESLRKTLALQSAEVWTGSGGLLEKTVSVPDRPVAKLSLSPSEESVVSRAGVTGSAWLEVWMPTLLEGRERSIIRVVPTTHTGYVLGLIVAVRPENGDQFTPDDDTMLTELARQVGLALHNVELDSALQASLIEVRQQAEELRASRARIVAASDAARRQIERNLHDGAQQHLVALAVNVRLARKLAETDSEASGEILDQLGDELQEAVQELRALAHGIYPPLLVDRGIEEALRSAAARSALPATVSTSDLGRYSPEVEAAVYFCCTEALQNAGKHAGQGATATLKVWSAADTVYFEVSDTGVGFDSSETKAAGAGFVNMSDRVGAIGGSVSVKSAPGAGTTVSGEIPLSSPAN